VCIRYVLQVCFTANCWLMSSCRLLAVELTYIHPFNGPFSRTTRVSRYQKYKTNLDSTEARDSEWQWHQPGHMQVCTSLQRNNHASTPPLSFFTGRMPFLPLNQQHQSSEGTWHVGSGTYLQEIAYNSSRIITGKIYLILP